MKKVTIVKITHLSKYYNRCKSVDLPLNVVENAEFQEITDEEFGDLTHIIAHLNSKVPFYEGEPFEQYAIVECPSQHDMKNLLISELHTFIKEQAAKRDEYLRQMEEQRIKAEEKRKQQAERRNATAMKRKQQQLEKLKKELGEQT